MASILTDTVVIDRNYFETLLRRPNQNAGTTAGRDAQISIPLPELTTLRTNARKFENLRRNLIRGGVEDATIDLLSKDDAEIQADPARTPERVPASTQDAGFTPTTHHATPVGNHGHTRAKTDRFFDKPGAYQGGAPTHQNGVYHSQPAWADDEPDEEGYCDEDTIADGPVGTNYVPLKKNRGPPFDQKCTRTVHLSNLPEGTTHADVTEAIRGGILLDIFLRPHDRAVSVSFLHAADARYFFDHVRKHDLYIKSKRVNIKWSERQYTLAGHAIGKISGGATRNFIIKGIDPHRHTEESIRDDLDHIYNLVVIKVEFRNGDCHVRTNSVNYALFARTCMMSRGKYRGTKIEWDVDECAQLYDLQPIPQVRPAKEPLVRNASNNIANRFHLLNIDGDEEDEIAATFQSRKSVGITAV